MSRRSWVPIVGLALSALAAAPRALATLGEPASSIAVDGSALAAKERAVTARGGYTVHELASGGYVLREFVAPGGLVFAVTWTGASAPDLVPLLGSYAGEYGARLAAAPRRRGRGPQPNRRRARRGGAVGTHAKARGACLPACARSSGSDGR